MAITITHFPAVGIGQPPSDAPFQVGDTVRLKRSDGPHRLGHVGKITEVRPRGFTPEAHGGRFVCRVDGTSHYEDDLELVSRKERTFCGIDPASDAPVDVKEACHRFNIEQQSERTGPHGGGSDLSHELMLFERQKADDEMSGRRAVLVANLAAERVKESGSAGLLHPMNHWGRLRGGRRDR
ncbi:MAG TPA: hypothetical protein VL494_13400 [Steroidobacteraceae bacterium]|nr:hypothetical protein [Steroidobacteraceae bacterium]